MAVSAAGGARGGVVVLRGAGGGGGGDRDSGARGWCWEGACASVCEPAAALGWVGMDRGVGGKARQRGLDGLDAVGRGVGAERQLGFQGFDMGIDLDLGAELVADVALEIPGDVMSGSQRHVAVDLEVDAYDQFAGEI